MDLDLPGIECPDCGATVKATLEDVAKQRTKSCRDGHVVRLQDSGGGARRATRAMDDFEKSLKRFGR